jgi:hypothetical protein
MADAPRVWTQEMIDDVKRRAAERWARMNPPGSDDVCECGKRRWQHEEQWPACSGFRERKDG